MICAQTTYALARARLDLELVELREALDRHEVARRWDDHERLERVARAVAALVEEVAKR